MLVTSVEEEVSVPPLDEDLALLLEEEDFVLAVDFELVAEVFIELQFELDDFVTVLQSGRGIAGRGLRLLRLDVPICNADSDSSRPALN